MLFKLSIKWNASKHGNTLREGDYFELELPDKFKYPEGSAYCDFNLHAGNGEVSAKVKVEPEFGVAQVPELAFLRPGPEQCQGTGACGSGSAL